jgi:hypothetical protein
MQIDEASHMEGEPHEQGAFTIGLSVILHLPSFALKVKSY